MKMTEAPLLPSEINNANTLTTATMKDPYPISTTFLKSSVCVNIFENDKYENHTIWSVSTWSKRVSYNVIKKNWTASDIINLPKASSTNQPRNQKNININV